MMDIPSPEVDEYPAWCQDDQVPVTKAEIKSIFNELSHKFGFQQSSKENMYHHFLAQLDSRACRTDAQTALISLHVSYIGGENANYRKWYFAAQLDLDDEIGIQNMKLTGKSHQRNKKAAKKRGTTIQQQQKQWKARELEFINEHPRVALSQKQLRDKDCLKAEDYKWKIKMKALTPYQMVRQIALYLLCWGEANQVRFAPECLCFIFKCALDYDTNTIESGNTNALPEYTYLNEVITPIYKFLRNQVYRKNSSGIWVRREHDHANIIGYDDINQLFWYPEGIERIVLNSGIRLVDKDVGERYIHLKNVNWSKAFYKTYYETRTWMHCVPNFNRFWIIHFAPFWFFTAYNSPTLYTKDYTQLLNNSPTSQAKLSAVAFGGAITCLVQIIATLFEWKFVPREWPGAQHLSKRLFGLIVCFALNFMPSLYIFFILDLGTPSKFAFVLSIIQLVFAILTSLFFAIRPLGGLFGSYLNKGSKTRRYSSSQTFTASFPKLHGRSRWFSYGLWVFVFLCKYIESYFFLTLSLRDPIRVLSILKVRCNGDRLLGTLLCEAQPKITLLLMFLSDLGLFFLDTYLWYIICNCIFSIILSFSLGTSIFTPWKNIYSKLPTRIYSKILATSEMDIKYNVEILVSQIWNTIIISMYREHLLSIENLQKLIYQQASDMYNSAARTLKSPTFFIAQDDSTFKSANFFPPNSEAERRISFFAQSLSTPVTEPLLVESMPTFTVIVPHYNEKIILSLKEVIKEESPSNKLTVLEYLKQLYPSEWLNFVRDTKSLNKPSFKKKLNSSQEMEGTMDKHLFNPDYSEDAVDSYDSQSGSVMSIPSMLYKDQEYLIREKINDLPYNYFGFNASDTLYTLRTRMWASLRSQTLFRTICGFMNYEKAIKLLYRVEHTSSFSLYKNDDKMWENELDNLVARKFRMVIAMQRYSKFTAEELEAAEILLRKFPLLHISYILEEECPDDGEIIYYSCLTNGYAQLNERTGLREPIFKIRLSGNPILGDGKSDNQNHSLIFYRGEYIQVIDANQDNYLEECLKIRSVLSEFEELDVDTQIPYIAGIEYDEEPAPVAIVGAREYIFSENIGVLGDIAAGKEQTFGTLFARTLAEIGGKLHYGHPDFINAIFMTTRGGISKAQKSLHLNEDIYAGMNAICRGGRIKHSDYYQCGKGRDLGFGSLV